MTTVDHLLSSTLLVSHMLSVHADALKALISLLAALAQHHTKNGMSAIMLGQALGPLLFRPGQDDRALGSGDVASWVESAVSLCHTCCCSGLPASLHMLLSHTHHLYAPAQRPPKIIVSS